MKNQKPTDLYLVSSTLHFFWAWLLAFKNKPYRNAHLWLIDQYTDEPMVFVPFIDQVESPFVDWKLFDGREKTGIKKLKLRKEYFNFIQDWAKGNLVDRVLIGNDRSVFGQFVIKSLKSVALKSEKTCVACFLDDGVFTYLGRIASKSYSERFIDSIAKKIMYGFWYDTPVTVGASKWIDEAWVMYPNLVSQTLKHKHVVELGLEPNSLEAFKCISEKVITSERLEESFFEALDVFITLPNERVFSKVSGYRDKLISLIYQYVLKNKVVAVKYHPAAGSKDILDLAKEGCVIVPSNISYEACIPFLNGKVVLGDLSTTLINSGYFKINAYFYSVDNGDYALRMKKVCEQIGVDRVEF